MDALLKLSTICKDKIESGIYSYTVFRSSKPPTTSQDSSVNPPHASQYQLASTIPSTFTTSIGNHDMLLSTNTGKRLKELGDRPKYIEVNALESIVNTARNDVLLVF